MRRREGNARLTPQAGNWSTYSSCSTALHTTRKKTPPSGMKKKKKKKKSHTVKPEFILGLGEDREKGISGDAFFFFNPTRQ